MIPPTVAVLVAATGAAALVWLSLPPPPVHRAPRSARVVVPAWGVLAATAGGIAVLAEGRTLVLSLILVGAAAGATRLFRCARRRREAGHRADRVVELCEALAGELRAGQPPLQALAHAAEGWDELATASSVAALGGDVPTALRRLARAPGAEGLRDVAGAWEVSSQSGATMALALARTAETARLRRATQRLVSSELASAQATARMVAALPFGLLLLGSGVGGDPWAFLLGTAVGLTCLALGLSLALLGLWWIERIAAAVVAP